MEQLSRAVQLARRDIHYQKLQHTDNPGSNTRKDSTTTKTGNYKIQQGCKHTSSNHGGM